MKTTVPDDFTAEIYQTIEEEMIQFLYKLLQKIEDGVTFTNLFYDYSISPIAKMNKDT